MTWTRIDDGWNDRVDTLDLSTGAELLHIKVLVFCNQALTDGYVSNRALSRYKAYFKDADALVRELISKGLWEEVEGGYQVEWKDQEEASAVERRAALNRERQKRFRERGQEMKEARSNGVTQTVSNTTPVPSRTVPSRPKDKGKGREGKEGGSPTSSSSPTASSSSVEPQRDRSDFKIVHEYEDEYGWGVFVHWNEERYEDREDYEEFYEKYAEPIMQELKDIAVQYDPKDEQNVWREFIGIDCKDEAEATGLRRVFEAKLAELIPG